MKTTLSFAIQDANILIDLVAIGMFDYCLSLPVQFITTDIILAELHDEQVACIKPHIHSGKFSVIAIPSHELLEIHQLSSTDERLSIQDWSAFYYALKHQAILMTGDRRLRSHSETKGLNVCGILKLFDELVHHTILIAAQACQFLRQLMHINRRLPVDECACRITQWCVA